VILAHHGFGEEFIPYAAAAVGGGAVPLMLALARARISNLRRRLRRR
jgi:hypothetical protein